MTQDEIIADDADQYDADDRDPNRADVIANDGASLHIANALYIWEGGEFSDWAEQHGFPLTIDGVDYDTWDGVEDALSNYPRGPYDPDELEDRPTTA